MKRYVMAKVSNNESINFLLELVDSGRNEEEILQIIRERNVNIETQDEQGNSLLHYAIANNSLRFAKLLIQCGAQAGINSKNKQGKNLLIQLIESYGIEKERIKRDLKSSKEPIFFAFDFSFIKLLIKRGIDINDCDSCGFTALHQALYYACDIKIIKLLLELGADVNAKECDGVTPLHIAASLEGNNKELLNLLMDCSAKINAKSIILGHDALHVAAKCHNIENIKVLLERGANIESKDRKQCTVLFTAINSYLNFYKDKINNDTSVVKHLVNKNANITAVDVTGHTCLFYLARANDLPVTKLLISKYKGNVKEFINKKNRKGFDALDIALEKGHREFVALLTSLGADIHGADSEGCTRLHEAVAENDARKTKLLLALRVNVNAQDCFGNTPLHLAVQEPNRQKIVKILLKKGADINIRNHNYLTPIDELCNVIKGARNNKYNELNGYFIKYMKERYNKDYRYYFTLITTISSAVITYMFLFIGTSPLPVTLTILFSGTIMLLSCFNQWKKIGQYEMAEHRLIKVTYEKATTGATNCAGEIKADHNQNFELPDQLPNHELAIENISRVIQQLLVEKRN